MGRTTPRAQVFLDGQAETVASDAGYFVVGFDRDAEPQTIIRVVTEDGEASHIARIAPGNFDIQRINGLPPNQVNPTGEALLARIKAEAERKAEGFASRADIDGFKSGFIVPLTKYRQSARFGGQRILNGEPRPPHYGADLAAPTGTPIRAPADGIVALADPDMHFEGGLTMIDHGQGLISLYLHQSRIDVRRGQTVSQGQVIGAVGMKGRATGPHLCWRMKWHGRNLDPMLMVDARTPA
ncbi:MAG: M23 family metallopeptidase [Phenylobacterium sp.]|nr:M23 family metallopeptidase [Phenylobacterium sp.]MDO8378240.1 M23 family metallopeptidase [Phenylobacterium sp.]